MPENIIEDEDRKIIMNYYKRSKRKIGNWDPDTLLANINWRLNMEYLGNSQDLNSPKTFFDNWINKETHYSIERSYHKNEDGKKKRIIWDDKNNSFIPSEGMDTFYKKKRQQILKAVVRRDYHLVNNLEELSVDETADYKEHLKKSSPLVCSLKKYMRY